jgi:8-oxo-dGTP pyrophosphatase MutT (NUDIX family)
MSEVEDVLPDRPTARWLILDGQGRVLLFRFVYADGPIAGTTFWATPGGAVDPGETYEEAARRELLEETGLRVSDVGPQVARRVVSFRLPDGRMSRVDQRFFLLRTEAFDPSSAGWTEEEQGVLVAHRWWSVADIRASIEAIWPEDLEDVLTPLI